MAELEKPMGVVADIGGTNGRFALVRAAKPRIELYEHRTYQLDQFASFEQMAQRFLDDCGQNVPVRAIIAVAGLVSQNTCRMTNGDWLVDGLLLQQKQLFSSCLLLNDFAALARSLPVLRETDLQCIGQQPAAVKTAAKLVIGPGTGLGAAFLVQDGSSCITVEGEGGHMAFAPVDELELQLLSWFAKKYDRVSLERILSGPGLVDLHEALAQIEGRSAKNRAAEDIMSRGLASDGPERQTLQRFCAILGSVAGDLVLAGGCWGGAYIGGGIAPRMSDLLTASSFRQCFEAKGRFNEKMRQTPSWLITHQTPALLGAAKYL